MARNPEFNFVCGVLVVVLLLASAVASSAYRVADGQRQRVGRALSAMPPLPPTIKLQPSQLKVLLALDQALALWNNSASNVICDEWQLVECNQDGMVTVLSAQFIHDSYGDVPAAITALSALQKLDLAINGFGGNLEILGHFPKLQYVDLSHTDFRGSIPETISNAKSLQYLNLQGLYLSGSLPGSISRLTALQSLRIGNPLHLQVFLGFPYLNESPSDLEQYQPFPVMQGSVNDLSCLAPLTRLQDLALMNLNLTAGDFPSSVAALPSLMHLDLSFLPITRLPQWIASLSKLTYLDVTGNLTFRRSALFPTEWMALTRLETLRAGLNGFTGSIPSTISALTALTILELYGNNISGSIPAGISKLPKLDYLLLGSNNITGAAPVTHAYLDLSWNQLTSMPSAIIADVLMAHNQLQGPLPSAVPTRLGILELQGNAFSGSLPNFDSLPYLIIFDVSDNQLSGSLPDSISSLVLLSRLGLGGNNLSGVIPASLCGLGDLTYLSMAHNQLQGPLPSALVSTGLRTLELQGNAFSGSLPNFDSLPYLHILDVSDNQLSGSLPDSISSLVLLSRLGIGGNNLSGVIPAGLGSLHDLTYLNVSGTGLTCPADGSKCVVYQSNTTGFCRLCFSFCSSCTDFGLSQARSASGPRTLIAAAINHSTAAAVAAVLLLVFGL
ncbi:unnamed protein product [Closterium sp. NIES-65]|nr:unnamed protein product [Closterium sp. NIES-65]